MNVAKILLSAALALAVPVSAFADEEDGFDWRWTASDYAMQAAVSAVVVVDWMQTVDLRSRGMPESNPFLGNHPGRDRVNLTIGGALIGHAVVSYLLPKPFRAVWQGVFIVIETGTVTANRKHGIGMQFMF